MITKCPETEMLLEYSAGSMQLAPSIAVTAHLNFCDACASTSKSLQDIGGHLLDQHCEEISDELLDDIFSRIDEPESQSQHSCEKDVACQATNERWKLICDSVLACHIFYAAML